MQRIQKNLAVDLILTALSELVYMNPHTYSDGDTILPYAYMVQELAKEMPWVTLALDPLPVF